MNRFDYVFINGIPVTPKLIREKIQENLDNFKNNIASNIIIQKPKPKI